VTTKSSKHLRNLSLVFLFCTRPFEPIMFITPGSRRFTATVFCVLAQASKTKCTKEDDKKPTDFTAFLNKVGDSKGDVFEKLKEAAKGINGNNEIDFGSMLDSKNVRKVFENGIPGQVS
jgi:hypothetical protein